jgi:RAB protein geranylgeranyltransferase component A
MSDKPIINLLNEQKIEERLRNILLYALGMINQNQEDNLQQIKSLEFFTRITKYLRSIGYYGDSPFMMCNYGSSEYSQAFSRVGSLYRNVYIVN